MAPLLGAGFALVPLLVGVHAARTADREAEPSWVPVVARSAVLLAGLSVLLRLVLAAVQSNGGAVFSRF